MPECGTPTVREGGQMIMSHPRSRSGLCFPLTAYCSVSVAVLVGWKRCMFTKLLHRREQLLAIAVRREIDTLALRDSPARALNEIRLFRDRVAKAGRRPAGVETCTHEQG